MQTPNFFAFAGGLDTNSPALATPPGAVISSFNYEPLAEGYGRVEGYERYDGSGAPSGESFWLLDFDLGSNSITSGVTVVGETSGASGIVLLEPVGFAGTWAGGNASGTLVLADVTGSFQDNESLSVNSILCAAVNGSVSRDVADLESDRQTYARAAVAWKRSTIGAVPGEGPVRGGAVHNGTVYAFRDAVGATHCQGYIATANGWVALGSLSRMTFATGRNIPLVGATVVGDSSGATGLVVNALQTGGDTANDTATGFIDLASITGTFTQGESIHVGAEYQFAGNLPAVMQVSAGGRIRAISHNFYGAANRDRVYAANGTGQAFEITEYGISLISTGMDPDTPERVFEIGNHLGLTFPGGSLQFSGTGEPHAWEPILGAGEIGFGTEITDVVQANETAVAIFGEQKIGVLQGSDASSFVLDTLTTEAGADADTAQRIARTVYVDKRGLRDLTATQAFGNFKTGALSGQFERYFRVKRKAGAKPIGSYLSKRKSQYRLVWDDQTALTVYMGGRNAEAMVHGFGENLEPFAFFQGEIADGEGIFMAAQDGYVYRLDSGPSFDGESVRGFVMTPFNHFGSPSQDDRFHKVILEMEAPANATIGITVQFDYGDGSRPIAGDNDLFNIQGTPQDFLINGGGGLWDTGIWDEFYWSAPVEARAEGFIDGIGRNACFIFATQSEVDEPAHLLQAYIVHRTPRRFRR